MRKRKFESFYSRNQCVRERVVKREKTHMHTYTGKKRRSNDKTHYDNGLNLNRLKEIEFFFTGFFKRKGHIPLFIIIIYRKKKRKYLIYRGMSMFITKKRALWCGDELFDDYIAELINGKHFPVDKLNWHWIIFFFKTIYCFV
jgi:hypothetical protein